MCRFRSEAPSSHQTGPPFAERVLDPVDGLVCGGLSFEVGTLLDVTDRPPGCHQLLDKIGPLHFIERGICHPP
jgi:hypothetical protein